LTVVLELFIFLQNLAHSAIANSSTEPPAGLGSISDCATATLCTKKDTRPVGGRGISAFSGVFYSGGFFVDVITWAICPHPRDLTVSFGSIVLKKSVYPNCLIIDWLKRLFCTLLREIRVRKPLPKVKISISIEYFSDAQTMADFFNRIGRFLPLANGSFGGR
jgi:hypothetical protein